MAASQKMERRRGNPAAILFEPVTLVHRCLHRCCLVYLTDIVIFHDTDTAVRHLWLLTTRSAVVKQTRTQFGQKAFSVAGPNIWNCLPPEIRQTENFATFKQIKTRLTWLFII